MTYFRCLWFLLIGLHSAESYSQGIDYITDKWSYFEFDTHMVVGSKNSANDSLALSCAIAQSECYYGITFGEPCEDKFQVPALITTDNGAISVNLICFANIFIITPFEQIDKIILNSKNMAVAIPLEGGQFSISRFTLVGADSELAAMGNKFRERVKDKMHQLRPKEVN